MKQYSLLLACDLDRTMLPNGPEPLSLEAKVMFEEFLALHNVCLVYISGRSLLRAEEGIHEFDIPTPDMFVSDVGTSIYERNEEGQFVKNKDWDDKLATSWGGMQGEEISKLISEIQGLTPQEISHQNTFKQSYYFTPRNEEVLLREVSEKLTSIGVDFEIVIHIDQDTQIGYLDILPQNASKKHALTFITKYISIDSDKVIYAGDSGNDLDVLTSGCKAILVNNATGSFKDKVKAVAIEKGSLETIYFARGDYKGLNGNYVAGVLEGLHYFGYLE